PPPRQLRLHLACAGGPPPRALQQVVAAFGWHHARRFVRIAHERAAEPAEPGRRRDVRPALEALHGRTLMDWARVGALSGSMELSSRIVRGAVPFLDLATSESCPAVRSKTLGSGDVMRRRGAGGGAAPT